MADHLTIEEASNDVAYYCDHGELHRIIIQTITKLPREVGEYVCEQCAFLSIGEETASGMVLPGRIGALSVLDQVEVIQNAPRDASVDELIKYVQSQHFSSERQKWIVLLNEDIVADSDVESVIAHEIAHAWLKHDRLGDVSIECEREAAELTKLWGFEGRGADLEFCYSAKKRGEEAINQQMQRSRDG